MYFAHLRMSVPTSITWNSAASYLLESKGTVLAQACVAVETRGLTIVEAGHHRGLHMFSVTRSKRLPAQRGSQQACRVESPVCRSGPCLVFDVVTSHICLITKTTRTTSELRQVWEKIWVRYSIPWECRSAGWGERGVKCGSSKTTGSVSSLGD